MGDEKVTAAPKGDKKNLNLNTYVWIAGAVILLIIGWFGLKALLGSFEGYRVTLVDAPKEATLGAISTFTWRIDGPPTTINHTVVYYGTVSNPGELGTEVKPEDTKYTGMVKDFANGKYDVPLQFIGNTIIDKEGKYYFRIQAQVKDKNYWSDEYTFEAKKPDYKVSLLAAPKEVPLGTMATFTWKVEGPPTTINRTVVYIGTTSTPGSLGKEVKPEDTKYTEIVKDFANGKYDIPFQFIGNIKMTTAGSYFFRAHAAILGNNYWTNEGTFEVK